MQKLNHSWKLKDNSIVKSKFLYGSFELEQRDAYLDAEKPCKFTRFKIS